ncbi:carbohydrate sulfotransferase 12-like isoform X2 [Amphibalanus amphitrite]|uniref:carbohydrate sulfotransferase 12-like isoform X2 n=1 Tax=Amphibalanus amphitrite TaxID=1232801 RepID=UPI001C92512C|nr:carbohydrate sulfotransferase 12-like isoform X2 [Amphibalanus amphitrite]
MLRCVPAPPGATLRRTRSLCLLTVLVTLAITQVLLRRQPNATLNSALGKTTGHRSHMFSERLAPEQPLPFYGAARHISDQRRAPETSPSSGLGIPESAVAAGEPATHDGPAQVRSGHAQPGGGSAGRPTERLLRWDRAVPEASEEQHRPLPTEWLWRRYREQRRRREVLTAACRRFNVTLAGGDGDGCSPDLATRGGDTKCGLVEEIKASHLSSAPRLKALACLVNKVASTSLLGTLLKLEGRGVPVYTNSLSSPHADAAILRPEPGELEMARQKYIKVMFVRHPMDRLISAYEDKVMRANHTSLLALREAIFAAHQHRFILKKAITMYSNYPDKKDELSKAYYAELADYKKETERRNNVPTFQEFLDFILSGQLTGDSFDSHWTPYWRQCAPCHMNYDVIGKLETGTDDFKYLWHLLGIYKTVGIPWLHGERRPASALDGRLRAYLGPLRRDSVQQLRRLFRPDFHMFGYDWRVMLDLSGHCQRRQPCDLE